MKTLLSFICVCVVACTLGGCNNNKAGNGAVSPGALKECPKCAGGMCTCVCCKEGGMKLSTASGCCCGEGMACCKAASMGAVGEAKTGGCCSEAAGDASMGAVGEKADCTGKVCPVTGQSADDASLGAVGEKKAGCCSGKTSG